MKIKIKIWNICIDENYMVIENTKKF